jgi:hypothetical protein
MNEDGLNGIKMLAAALVLSIIVPFLGGLDTLMQRLLILFRIDETISLFETLVNPIGIGWSGILLILLFCVNIYYSNNKLDTLIKNAIIIVISFVIALFLHSLVKLPLPVDSIANEPFGLNNIFPSFYYIFFVFFCSQIIQLVRNIGLLWSEYAVLAVYIVMIIVGLGLILLGITLMSCVLVSFLIVDGLCKILISQTEEVKVKKQAIYRRPIGNDDRYKMRKEAVITQSQQKLLPRQSLFNRQNNHPNSLPNKAYPRSATPKYLSSNHRTPTPVSPRLPALPEPPKNKFKF